MKGEDRFVAILKGITIGCFVFLGFLILLVSCLPEVEEEQQQPLNVVPTTTVPTIAPVSPQEIAPPPVTVDPPSVYYSSCKQARAAGAAPLYLGEPGYRSGLDADGDGKACERK